MLTTRAALLLVACLLATPAQQPATNPDPALEAVRSRFSALADARDDAGISALGRSILERETSPRILQEASRWDKADASQLLEKAIALRIGLSQKSPARQTREPALDELRWSYARALVDRGLLEGAVREAVGVIDASVSTAIDDRSAEFAKWCAENGRLSELALDYLKREQSTRGLAALIAVDLNSRASIYEKLGRPEIALEYLARSFAQSITIAGRDRIAATAARAGLRADDIFERASKIRNEQAKPAFAFELEKDTGGKMKLADIKAKAVIVTFFFPT